VEIHRENSDSMTIEESSARREILLIGKRLYQAGFVIATDGNLSVRLAPDRYLVTASGVCKGEMTDRDLVVCDSAGKVIQGRRVSSEVLLHLTAYRLRPDIHAAIHAHPPTAIAFTLAGITLSDAILPEVVMSLGTIPTTTFAAPASVEGADVIKDLILNHDALLLDRHGSFTVGKTLLEAFQKLERIEAAARIIQTARTIGDVKRLNETEMAQIQQALARYREGAE